MLKLFSLCASKAVWVLSCSLAKKNTCTAEQQQLQLVTSSYNESKRPISQKKELMRSFVAIMN